MTLKKSLSASFMEIIPLQFIDNKINDVIIKILKIDLELKMQGKGAPMFGVLLPCISCFC